ncbi:synaptotagmin-like protein 2 isoform X2 [Takifugu rubripes]|uniref:Synaptotagmin-like protein 2 n=2 Tax=Takifugu rubripes TaxID=31033 RepID=A0A3B5KGR2_TAKRU|nr:synaptotagmin-like protein 2 isoform X2 [Takifugu rubripes]XP_029700121.1 synaptotagmin-like protein 2 isoform X2 [Takifugu rubripes]
MIDLSHLTEEEQGAIMTVLRRDAELKRAEDDRVSKLEKTHNTGSKPDSQWKYLSGEWFYEAKSRRHMDKIHGSEVILASMKAQTAPFDGSPLSKRSPTPSSSGLKVGTPPKPARSLENLQLATINDLEKEKKSPIFSPRMQRKNPFNQGSMIIYEAPDNISFVTSCQKPELSQTADASLLRSNPGEDFSQTSDTSSTSEGSSPAFRPVPRKRTFLSRHPSSSDPDAPVGPASIVPSPGQRRQLAQRVAAPQESPQQPMNDDDQPVYSEDKYGGTPSQKMDSSDTESGSDADVALEERREEPRDERLGERAALRSDVLRSGSIQDTVGGGDSAGPAGRPDELSLPQSTADPDPPVSYDLNFIDKSDKQMKKSNQKNVFTLTTQSTSPTGDEESIAKVLDWFSRSTDRSDWLNSAGGAKVRMGSDHNVVVSKSRSEDSFLNEGEGTSELLQKKINEAKALRAAHRSASSELLEIEEPQQQVYVPHLRSVWERHKIGPKVLIIKSMMSKNRGQTPARLSDRHEGNKMDMTSEPGRYSREIIYKGESERRAVVRPQTDTEYTSPSSSSQEAHGPNTSARNYRNYSDLEAGAQAADRRGSDPGSVNVPRPRQERIFHPRLSVETESLSTSNPRPDRISQSTEIQLRDESSRTPKSEADLQTRYSPGSYSGNKSYVDNPQGGNDALIEPKTQTFRSLYKDASWNSDDRGHSPQRNVQDLPQQESSADKIKQLRSFWEQERKPTFYSRNVTRGPSQSKVSKRFTKSEYDLTALGNGDRSEEINPNVVGTETESANLTTSRTQFNSLRDFWDEATSGKPKSTARKETVKIQFAAKDFRRKEPEIQPKTRPVAAKLSPTLQGVSTVEGSRDLPRQDTLGKENRPHRSRKDSYEASSSRANSIRRAASMFALSALDENDQVQMDTGPSQPQSRNRRQYSQKNVTIRKPPEESETPTPRARAYIPSDYRHYLGMTDEASFQASLAPNPEDEGEKGGFGFDPGRPVHVSTPVSSEGWHSRKSTKVTQRPLWANYSSDTGPDSSLSSTSDSWSNSKKYSDRGDDTLSPVRKALMRAETRSKSLEDLTASPVQERRQDTTADIRGASDVSSMPSPASSLFSDKDHLKNMSKSVPLFLQKEDDAFTDSNSDQSYHSGQLTKGGSLTNLTSSSGLSSLSGSMMTMYGGDLEVQGNIMFSINYIQKLREFHIFVAQCQDLAAADLKKGRSNPYVKSYLVPDKSNLGKRKTSVKKKTLNPTFNEILRYRVNMEYLRTQTLILSVWHHDTFGRNSFLGEVDVDLFKWDFGHTRMNYFPLKSRTPPNLAAASGRGQLKLAIRYLPQISHSEGVSHFFNGEIHIWVKECRDLPLIRATINPYVKCFVLPDTSRKSRQKTRVVRRAVDPVFNHTMVYDGIRDIDLTEACVELTVWDRDKLATNLLGGLRLGIGTGTSYGALVDWMDSTPSEVALWERMKSTPNEWVEDVLPLRILNPARATFK